MTIIQRGVLAFALALGVSDAAEAQSASPLAQFQRTVAAVPWLSTTGQVKGPLLQGAYNSLVPIFNSMGTWDPVTGAFTPNPITNLPISSLAPIAANSVLGNSATVSGPVIPLVLPGCSAANNGLSYSPSVGFGCNTYAGSISSGTLGQIAYYPAAGTNLSGETVSGDITIAPGGAASLVSLGSAAGPVGSGVVTPVITTDAKGRVSVISSATIAPPFTALTGSLQPSQVPAFAGPCSIAAGGTTISCATLLGQTNTWALAQTFTTSPIMPTLVATDNSTKGATTAYVTTAVGNLAAVTAPLASPALTGSPTAPTQALGDNTTKIATDAFVIANAVSSQQQGYIGGLTLSNDATTPNTVLDIAAGVATSDDVSTVMKLTSAYTKSLASTWAVGSNAGGLDTGTVLASTWYHVFLIERTDTGVVDVLFSASVSSPVLPTSYTKKRRIGSIKTNSSSQILAFSQDGEEFLWSTPVNDVNTTALGTTAILYTLSVPPGVKVRARLRGYGLNAAGSNSNILVTSPDEASAIPLAVAGNLTETTAAASLAYGTINMDVRTNTSGQVRTIATIASTTLVLATYGWIDTRGRFN